MVRRAADRYDGRHSVALSCAPLQFGSDVRPRFHQRAPIETAPRDGTLVLVWLRASEQGPAQMDVVRWARSARSGEGAWVARDSDQVARVFYSDADLAVLDAAPDAARGA